MQKKSAKPAILVERFELSQSLASCSGIKISSLDADCVVNDPDSWSTPMFDLALSGNFMPNTSCVLPPVDNDADDGICYFTSVNMAFTS